MSSPWTKNKPHRYCKARYTLAIKLKSTRSTLLKVDKVDRVTLAPYPLATKTFDIRATESTVSATKSTELATVSTATSCRIQVVVDLSPVSSTVDFVASIYRALLRSVGVKRHWMCACTVTSRRLSSDRLSVRVDRRSNRQIRQLSSQHDVRLACLSHVSKRHCACWRHGLAM